MLIEKVAPKGGDTRNGKLRKLVLESDDPSEQESLARLAEGLQRGLRITVHDEDASLATTELTIDELDLCRQWFDAVQDLHQDYLDTDDYILAYRIFRRLGMRIPDSITQFKDCPRAQR